MTARDIQKQLEERFGLKIQRADIPADGRLFVYIEPKAVREVCQFLFVDLDARYCVGIGCDERETQGKFMVAHDFACDKDHVLISVLTLLDGENPVIDSIADIIPAANWSEREFRDLVGIVPEGHPNPKRLVLPDGWPEDVHPLRHDLRWDNVPDTYDASKTYDFDNPPEGTVVVPFGPFHPTLDEPSHFRLFVEGEVVKGCEYRGFMVHRGVEKLADSVLTYNEIPMLAERICGICGCVHNVAYAQAVEQAAAIQAPPRAEFIRTIMLEIERLHSHLLWAGLACHILGFDTLFMQSFRIREPVMWISEKISGNRKTYALCVIGGVRFDITPELKTELLELMDKLEKEWTPVVGMIAKDRNIQRRTKGVGVATPADCKALGLLGPVARAAGVAIDDRVDHPYAAYDKVDFQVITQDSADVWGRIIVRALEVLESIKIIRQSLALMPDGPITLDIDSELPAGRLGMSAVEAPRGEAHHFVITGDDNRPRRWRVRAPTYQNLQGVPGMIKDQMIADMTISLGSIDPCFSCTDRLEVVDIRSGEERIFTQEELYALVRESAQ